MAGHPVDKVKNHYGSGDPMGHGRKHHGPVARGTLANVHGDPIMQPGSDEATVTGTPGTPLGGLDSGAPRLRSQPRPAIVAWHTLSRQGNYGLTYLVTPAPSSHRRNPSRPAHGATFPSELPTATPSLNKASHCQWWHEWSQSCAVTVGQKHFATRHTHTHT